jgi:peptidoglycan biosynthesis protein MviN/MurJ (putative lipid II flippase)
VQAIALALGATVTADALLLSLTVLTLFDVVFVSGAAILTAQAIYIRRHAGRGGRTAIAGLARSAALWTWIGLVFGAFCAVAARPIAAIIAPGFSPEARTIFAQCCALASLLPAASSLMVFASALNRINGREVLYTVNPLVINGLSWLAIGIAVAGGANALEIARAFLLTVVSSTLMMFAWQLHRLEPAQRKALSLHFLRAATARRVRRQFALHRRELRAVSPIVGALLIQQVMTLVSYAFATRAGSGFLLLFGLAERLVNVIFAVFVMTFLTVLEPRWARAVVNPEGSREVAADVAVICAALIPLTATLMFAGDSLATLLFGHGAVSDADINNLADVTRVYALTLPGLSLGVVLARLLIIRNRGSRIFYANIFVALMHLGLCAVFFHLAGAPGVAAALAVSLSLQAAAYAWYLAQGRAGHSENLGIAARLGGVALVVVVVAWLLSRLELQPLLRLILISSATLIATFAGARLLGVRLLESMLRLARL